MLFALFFAKQGCSCSSLPASCLAISVRDLTKNNKVTCRRQGKEGKNGSRILPYPSPQKIASMPVCQF